jgi:signal transduction histidine kinase
MALSVPLTASLRAPLARLAPLTLAARYNLASLLVLLAGMLLTGWWVGLQIREGVIHRTSATASLYVENFLVTQLQDLSESAWLPRSRVAAIEKLLAQTPLGREIVSVKIWAPGGKVVYGQDAGKVFPVKEDLLRAWRGEVSSDITNLDESENASQRGRFKRLIETYTPMRLEGSARVIAVAEFYQTAGPLEREIAAAQARSWTVVAAATLLTWLALSGLVRRGSDTIARQQVRLREQVETLETVLAQNEGLHGRVRRAAARHGAHSERFLLRVSSDLHDGPAQDLSYALLRLEGLSAYTGLDPAADTALREVERSLASAVREMRAIATDLRLPDLQPLGLRDVLERVVRDHRRRTDQSATLQATGLPQQAPMPVRIAAYRTVQEALNNAHRHAPGSPVSVEASLDGPLLVLRVCDHGPGFSWNGEGQDGHLGLAGMRERAESLGGSFTVRSCPVGGTCAEVHLPLDASEPVFEPGTGFGAADD